MRNRMMIAYAAALICLSLPAVASAQITMGELREFPHAGVALAVPAGFQMHNCAQALDVMRAVLSEKGQPIQGVTLSTLPIDTAGATADMIADNMLAEQRQSLIFRNIQVTSQAPMTIAGIEGTARFFSYNLRDQETVAASAYFIRNLPEGNSRICYILNVEAVADRKADVLPVLGEVAKTVRLLPVQRPIDIKTIALGRPVASRDGLYSLRIPLGWFAEAGANGLAMGQMDYLANQVAASASVVVGEATSDADLRSLTEKCIAAFRSAVAEQNLNGGVISQKPAKLAGLEACQLVFEQSPKSARAETMPAKKEATTGPAEVPAVTMPAESPTTASAPASQPVEHNLIIVQRTTILPASGGKGRRSLSFVLVCQDTKPEAAEALMERLAPCLELHLNKATSRPAGASPGGNPLPRIRFGDNK